LEQEGDSRADSYGETTSDSTSCHKTNRKLIVTLDYKSLHAPQKKNKTLKCMGPELQRTIRGLFLVAWYFFFSYFTKEAFF